ncbi:NAD kinase 2, mitochondrial isoform X2 [Mobula birostris]|uniref:NAD kinase 2, mitochondrial isoform X2 n=1 Tax=Mobula birostris TaxID=1983395 RepID=UPI003B28D92E
MALAVLRRGLVAALLTRGRAWSSGPGPGPFQPQRVAVVAKTTRFEFEQQRGGEREAALRQRLATKGSSYCGLLERHHRHTLSVQHVLDSLRKEGIEVRLVKRRDYTEETVRWADAIVSAGGDGTMLLTASKVFGHLKPVIGVNTDPERSLGHLCLPLRYTHCFSDALRKLQQGEFRWQWRQRIRICLEGVGFNATPVDLHEQQLSLEQHTTAHRKATNNGVGSRVSDQPELLPVRALNEVFVGESLSSRSYNINKLASQEVEDLLLIAQKRGHVALQMDRESVEQVTDHYNDSLIFSPEERRLFFSIREPIVNRVFTSTLHRGFTSKMAIRSRCWDACMVVDGGTSFEFNDGAVATLTVEEEDALCTVLLEE